MVISAATAPEISTDRGTLLMIEGVYPPRVDQSDITFAAAANDVHVLVRTGGRQGTGISRARPSRRLPSYCRERVTGRPRNLRLPGGVPNGAQRGSNARPAEGASAGIHQAVSRRVPGARVREWALRQGWGGRPVRQEQAQGMLVAALGLLAAHYGLTAQSGLLPIPRRRSPYSTVRRSGEPLPAIDL